MVERPQHVDRVADPTFRADASPLTTRDDRLHVNLLGGVVITRGDSPPLPLVAPRLQALLALLALQRSTPQPRGRLAALLWPDSTEEQARTNLRLTLHRLRQALPDADRVLQLHGPAIGWRADAPVLLDVALFEAALQQADELGRAGDGAAARAALEEAVQLYRGDLVPDCFDDWIVPARDRLRTAFATALRRMRRLAEQDRDYAEAITQARRLLEIDPLEEKSHHALIRLLALNGDRTGALRAYHACATTLERELGVTPSRPTQEAYERLLRSTELPAPPAETTVASVPLVGRRDEWAQLCTAWERAQVTGPQLAVILGEAGIGKTRLAEEIQAWVERQGYGVAATRGYALGSDLVYGPMADLLRAPVVQAALRGLDGPTLAEAARVLPELLSERPDVPRPGPLTEEWQRQHFFAALARTVLASGRALLLVIDDLHWADHETLAWLHYLLRYDAQARLLVVGTIRTEELEPAGPLATLLAGLQRSGAAYTVELGPLDATTTAALAGHVAGTHLDETRAIRLYQETEGNPLFIVETVRAAPHAAEAAASPAGAPLPATVQAVITHRLDQLSAEARNLAGLAATIGRAFAFDVLVRAEGDEDRVLRGLDELWRRRIVREDGEEGYDFSHDRIREAAYTGQGTARRRVLHRRVAQALEALNGANLDVVSGQLALHYERAGWSAEAALYSQRAGDVARRVYANAEAVRLYRHALALLEQAATGTLTPETRQAREVETLRHLGDVLAFTGQHAEARAAFEDALSRVPPTDAVTRASLEHRIGTQWQLQQESALAADHYDRAEAALKTVSPDTSPGWWHEWIEIELERMSMQYELGDWLAMVRIVDRLRPAVDRAGTLRQQLRLRQETVVMACRRDRYRVDAETVALAREALALSLDAGDRGETARRRFLLGFAALCHDGLDEAEAELRRVLDETEQIGLVDQHIPSLVYLATIARRTGREAEARALAEQGLAMARDAQIPMYEAMCRAHQAWLAWRARDWDGLQHHARAALEIWRGSPIVYAFQWAALWPLLDAALLQDRADVAVEQARALLEPAQQRPPAALERLLTQGVEDWDRARPDAARAALQDAATLARDLGYL